jgi:DNA-binding HxlR family transcriptional regulator
VRTSNQEAFAAFPSRSAPLKGLCARSLACQALTDARRPAKRQKFSWYIVSIGETLLSVPRQYQLGKKRTRRHILVTMDDSLPSLGVETTVAIFGGKWCPLILLQLIPKQRHFGELRRLVPGISKRILVTQLRRMENEKIIRRKPFGPPPAVVEYALTDYGRSLIPLLDAMCKWGHRHADLYPRPRSKTTLAGLHSPSPA